LQAESTTIGGGLGNSVRTNSPYSTVAGGARNAIDIRADASTISGGINNSIEPHAEQSTIGGGRENTIQAGARWAAVGGGFGNEIAADASTISGGIDGYVGSLWSYIGGGYVNEISTESGYSAVTGGSQNRILEYASTSTIGGGQLNTVSNRASAGTISGGYNNMVTGPFGAVPGGSQNLAGANSFAAGHRSRALHQGAFVWGDSTDSDVPSAAENSFAVRASGGTVFYSSPDLASGVVLSPGSGSWSTLSDRSAKENVEPVDSRAVLEKLSAVSLATWNYKTQDKSVRHIGPMAQEFHDAFGVGENETHIATIDEGGVALAAIQGLNQNLKEAEQEITRLKARLDKLEQLLSKKQGL